MIRKLKIKFMGLSFSALLALFTVIIVVMNTISYTDTVANADEILDIISENKGNFPNFTIPFEENKRPDQEDDRPEISPELPYESRYFWVLLNKDGEVIRSDVSKIASVDNEKALEYAKQVLSNQRDRGFVHEFRFVKKTEGQDTRITFLDCGRKLESVRFFFTVNVLISFGTLVLMCVILWFLSDRIIHPIIESYEKQKRFITDAGHEIKTPLAIINANVDVLEMDMGTNESLEDIKSQTKKLTQLTNNLVFLSKMEEETEEIPKYKIDLTQATSELSNSFEVVARSKGKNLTAELEKDITILGNELVYGRMVSILLENAVKYSSEKGEILLNLSRQSKWVVLSVSNPVSTPMTEENLEHLFDRFYRTDESRNSNLGGHGIGLSIVKAIIDSNAGKLNVEFKDGIFKITVMFQHI